MYREGGRISCIPRVSQSNRETWQVCVCDETHITHSCYAGENGVVFLGVKNTFLFAREGNYAMTSKLPQSW